MLYDANTYWKYDRFDLDELGNDQCKAEFRFYKNDIFTLAEYLQLPDEIVTYNGLVVGSTPALCIYLKRFTYPCRYGDMVSHFARPVPELCIITNHMIDWIYNRWHHLPSRYNHDLLSPANLMLYADAIYRSGAALENCWGFIDGTVRPVCRPGENQRAIYNGHKRVHSVKFQSVALPNGLVGHLYGPVEGKRHDSGMFPRLDFYKTCKDFLTHQLLVYLCVCMATLHTLLEHTYRDLTREQC